MMESLPGDRCHIFLYATQKCPTLLYFMMLKTQFLSDGNSQWYQSKEDFTLSGIMAYVKNSDLSKSFVQCLKLS